VIAHQVDVKHNLNERLGIRSMSKGKAIRVEAGGFLYYIKL
jgi:hypothetical protein